MSNPKLNNPKREDLIPARLAIGLDYSPSFPGYITGEKWNGFERALFEPAVMKQIIEHFKAIDPENWEECWGIDDLENLEFKDGLYDFGLGYTWLVVDDESEES